MVKGLASTGTPLCRRKSSYSSASAYPVTNTRRLCEAGYPPYRLGVQSMAAAPIPRDDSGAVMERLKRAFDPNGILAPGRYDFRETWPRPDGE